ncbi:hypothetical protein HON52_03125 [Candidatus Uhrbacteria bacterium]|jgi:hypothetical protein|nr:hypothetical protein [Candidatus Uhrbacteria bacterium]
MRRLLIILLFPLLLPTAVLAGDFDSCDDTPVCTCEPTDSYPADSADIESIDDCQDHCTYSESLDETITGYSIQCTVSGATTVLSQGELESIDEALTEITETSDPVLGVEIPGLEFSPAYTDGESVVSNYIGEYIEAVYIWIVPVASLLAVLVLMIAGMQYMLARGDSGRIAKAKERVKNAITGVVLLLGIVTMASMVDPSVLTYDSLKLSYIDAEQYVDESPDTSGSVDFGSVYIPPSSQMLCDPQYSISEIAMSTVGWVTYRYGGKGTAPPYTAETKIDPSGRPYSEYCPDETLCLDCSGYADFIRQCAGLAAASESGGTAAIFDTANGAVEIDTWDPDGTVNGTALVPGDMIGYPSSHVLIYIGDGNIADSHGSGREPGEAIGVYELSYGVNLYLSQGKTPLVRRR